MPPDGRIIFVIGGVAAWVLTGLGTAVVLVLWVAVPLISSRDE